MKERIRVECLHDLIHDEIGDVDPDNCVYMDYIAKDINEAKDIAKTKDLNGEGTIIFETYNPKYYRWDETDKKQIYEL